jgi:hypothetical protein
MRINGSLVFRVWSGSEWRLTIQPGLNDDQRHHVGVTLSSQGVRLYVDGSPCSVRRQPRPGGRRADARRESELEWLDQPICATRWSGPHARSCSCSFGRRRRHVTVCACSTVGVARGRRARRGNERASADSVGDSRLHVTDLTSERARPIFSQVAPAYAVGVARDVPSAR